MVEINPLSTLFVGIDVSSKNNVVYAMDFNQHKAFSSSFANSQPGAEQLEKRLEQFIALKRLTRQRLHLVECMTREKTYMVSNMYLKFSELQLLDGDNAPFCDVYGATSSAVLTEYYSL